jgi:hypothetical protein
MADFVNTNPHSVVVRDSEGERRRYPPGKFEADDSVEGTPGVVSADSQEGQDWEQLHGGDDEEAQGGSLTDTTAALLGEARSAARRFLSATNQVVVGDDEAPFGPDTGTVTTKQAHIEGVPAGDPERVAFADHEAFPSEVQGKSVTDVHAQQAVDTEAVNQLAAEILDDAAEGEARGPAAGGLSGTGSAAEVQDSGRHGRAQEILDQAGEGGDESEQPKPKRRSRKQEPEQEQPEGEKQ